MRADDADGGLGARARRQGAGPHRGLLRGAPRGEGPEGDVPPVFESAIGSVEAMVIPVGGEPYRKTLEADSNGSFLHALQACVGGMTRCQGGRGIYITYRIAFS